MQDNVAAPASVGEAAPLDANTNTAPAPTDASAQPELTAEQVATFLGTTPETLKSYQDFVSNNGGWEKGLNTYKRIIAARQPVAPAQPQPVDPAATVPTNVPTQPQQPAQPAFTGGISTEEFMTQQYFESLSQREEYATVANQIRSGEVLKEMAKFNIQPMINGRINSEGIKNFMDLYAKTVPPAPAQAPVTPTPTVEYVQVSGGDNITTMNEAMAVLAQDRELRAMGREGHPLAKAANEFFDNALNAQQNRGKVTHKTLDELRKK